MSKTSSETLAESVREELITYLRSGVINQDHLAGALGFDDLDIADFDRLKRIHFVLYPEVIRYVEQLPERLRNIKRAHARQQTLQRHVTGSIDWRATTKLRYSDNYGDSSVFVCNSPYLEYDVPENILLKKLLWLIYSTIQDDIRHIDYSAGTDDTAVRLWDDDTVASMEAIFEQNIHLNRIRDIRDVVITSSHLEAARKSRDTLYTRAYDLYKIYDDLRRNRFGSKASDVLRNTLIVPGKTHRLFELYVIFRLLRWVETESEMVLQPLEKHSDMIAHANDGDRQISVYHDSAGELRFTERIAEQDETAVAQSSFLRRHKQAAEEYATLSEHLLGDQRSMSLYSGRPDIVIEVSNTDTDTLSSVVIGEVKYTTNRQTFLSGLEELTEYMNYCRHEGQYIKESDIDMTGLLVTDGVETPSGSHHNIAHRTTDEFETQDTDTLFAGLF
jgi:hypothetical protein